MTENKRKQMDLCHSFISYYYLLMYFLHSAVPNILNKMDENEKKKQKKCRVTTFWKQ